MIGAEPTRMAKHSVMVAGHATSISLETAFWEALRQEAQRRCVSLAALIGEIDAARGKANLSSALRVYLLQQTALSALGQRQPEAPK